MKFEDYAAHDVGEYWIVDPAARSVEQYLLKGDTYELRQKAKSGKVASQVIRGFEIAIRAVFDERENLAVLRRILLA